MNNTTPTPADSPPAGAIVQEPPKKQIPAADRFLRWIAFFKLLKGTLLILVACGAFDLLHPAHRSAVVRFIEHTRADPHNRHIHTLVDRLLGIPRYRLEEIGFGTLFYATMFYVEGVGLWMRKRWAEWLTAISGVTLIPIEIWELIHKPHLLRALVLVISILIVAYLIWYIKRNQRHHD